MDVTQATTSTVSSTAANGGTESVISSDFETFLVMLTTQLENQDPLNPVESADFAVQLATFSGVEQQVLTNDLLSSLSGQLTASGMADYANWVGMEARVAGPAAYSGQPVTVYPSVGATAETAQLVVLNDFGNEVARVSFDPTDDTVAWGGLSSTGAAVPYGNYSFRVEGYDAEGDLVSSTAGETYASVVEVQMTTGSPVLVLESGETASPEAVTALRAP